MQVLSFSHIPKALTQAVGTQVTIVAAPGGLFLLSPEDSCPLARSPSSGHPAQPSLPLLASVPPGDTDLSPAVL